MNDTDYRFGSEEESPAGPDNRSDYRLTARARVRLELESRVPDIERAPGDDHQRDLVCQIRDISTRGMSLLAPEPLSIGALLPASVFLGQHAEPFRLMVEVVWCRPNESAFLVGAQILESDETSYVEWVDAVAAAMAR